MATAASRLVRVLADEHQPGPPVILTSGTIGQFSGARGTTYLSNGSGNYASGFASFAFGFTPGVVLATAHEGNTLATVQSWSSSGFTITLNKTAGGILGTVGCSWVAIG